MNQKQVLKKLLLVPDTGDWADLADCNILPVDPHGAASTYIAVAEAVAMREERLDDMMGENVLDPSWFNDRFHWGEEEGGADEGAGNQTVCFVDPLS